MPATKIALNLPHFLHFLITICVDMKVERGWVGCQVGSAGFDLQPENEKSDFFSNQKKLLRSFQEADVTITIFSQFSAKKLAFFLKIQCCDQIFAKSTSSLSKNANVFAIFFGENVLRIITLIPGTYT
jgi:hypothetical protein